MVAAPWISASTQWLLRTNVAMKESLPTAKTSLVRNSTVEPKYNQLIENCGIMINNIKNILTIQFLNQKKTLTIIMMQNKKAPTPKWMLLSKG